MLVAKFHNNFPILPQKDPENPLKMEISIENYHLVSKFPVLTGNSWVGGSSFSEIPVSRHMSTNLHKCPPLSEFFTLQNSKLTPLIALLTLRKVTLWLAVSLADSFGSRSRICFSEACFVFFCPRKFFMG